MGILSAGAVVGAVAGAFIYATVVARRTKAVDASESEPFAFQAFATGEEASLLS